MERGGTTSTLGAVVMVRTISLGILQFNSLTRAVWSHLYSYSFEQNPDWSADYAGQEEILGYLEAVARKYDLYRHIRFNTSVSKAEWDDANGVWNVDAIVSGGKEAEFCKGYTIKSTFLVSAVGQLNIPRLPDIKGLSDFEGKVMHSARWDWSYDFGGKKVAVIGTGSTAAQIVPEVAKVAQSLAVHQRDPNWMVPRFNKPIPQWRRSLYRYLPMVRWLKRSGMMDFREKSYNVVVLPTPQMGEWYEGVSTAHMKNQLPGREDLWRKFTPNYKLGCKRVVVSDDYYPTFLRDNVTLETGHIDRISANGIVVDGREEQYDLIVLATGFRSVDFMYPIQIVGHKHKALDDVWTNGPEALNGVCVQDLPNFAMLYGPNTNLSHNSIILMIEAQSRYINTLISKVLKARGIGVQLVLQPNAKKLVEYNQRIQSELARTNYADPNCSSWYKMASNGRITNNWSSTAVEYQKASYALRRMALRAC